MKSLLCFCIAKHGYIASFILDFYLFQDIDNDLIYLDKIIKEQLKCYKCHLALEPPFKECAAGHIVCSPCQRGGSKCPLCLGELRASCKLVEQLLKLQPKPCKYSDRGCSNVSVNGRHEPVCEFRTINCMMGIGFSCPWSGTVKDWKDHVPSMHKSRTAVYHPTYYPKEKWSTSYTFVKSWNSVCIYIYHEVRNQVFLFIMKESGDQIHFAVRYIPVQKDNYEFYLKLTGTTYNSHLRSRTTSRTTSFLCAVKGRILEESETIENIVCEFNGVLMSDVSKGEVQISFETIKVEK